MEAVQHNYLNDQPRSPISWNPQKMTTVSGEAKGLKAVLEECGFDIKGLKAKCSLVCPFESQKCCLAWLLSQQDVFVNQESMLKTLIKEVGHKCLFLPKFLCKLNPIEMMSFCMLFYSLLIGHTVRFIATYEQGLTGRATAWAVKQQKTHWSTSETVITAIKCVLVNNQLHHTPHVVQKLSKNLAQSKPLSPCHMNCRHLWSHS